MNIVLPLEKDCFQSINEETKTLWLVMVLYKVAMKLYLEEQFLAPKYSSICEYSLLQAC